MSLWFLFPIWLLGTAVMYFFTSVSNERQLRDWCERNGYKIDRLEQRHFHQGPFYSWLSVKQSVFFILVRDASDVRLEGFVRCGHWLMGTLFGGVDSRLRRLDSGTKEEPNQ
jgi:hypothetical protein